jgi:hypothetical protein
MNDTDLEQRLRSQAGPREKGYVLASLPTSIDSPRASRRGGTVFGMAVLIPAVAAGVVAVAIGAAALSQPPRGLGTSESPTASPSVDVTGVCRPGELVAAAEDWGGAAGSRGTVVTIEILRRGGDCRVDEPFTVTIRTTTGVTLAEGASPAGPSEGILIGQWAGDARVGVSWSNWCDDPIRGDVVIALEFRHAGEVVVKPGGPRGSEIPPCMGDGLPPTISITALERTR